MAYRRPAVTVIQEFIGLVPALAAFALPSVAVGAAYQIVNDDALGLYDATETAYAYASLMGGAAVDLADEDPDELYPATKKPISAYLKDAKIEIVPEVSTGHGDGSGFTDPTLDQFIKVLPGDEVVIEEALSVSIVSAQTNGQSTNASGLRDRLTAGVSGQFANVKVGDTVNVTAGTNTTPGVRTVTVKISNDVLKLDADINNGVGTSTNVAYSIVGDRSTLNQGSYKIKDVTNVNTLVLESPLPEPEAPIKYFIRRKIARIDLTRLTSSGDGFFPEASGVTLGATITYMIGIDTYNVLEGTVYASYRALRNDLAASVVEYARLSDVQSAFGVDQITPANPLAFALSIMLQNTVTPVNGLGLDGNAVSDETLSFEAALDVLALTEMYALVPLTQNPVIHQLFKTHVEGFSAPEKRKERVAIVNRKLLAIETLADESTTVTTVASSRIIVNTQLDGSGTNLASSTLNDATSNQFLNVKRGDLVVVVGGTNVTPGQYPVLTRPSVNLLTVSGVIFTGISSNVQYYIIRQDGLGSDGQNFYDRNATFISNGVAAGHFLHILSGGLKGRYKIGNVISEKELTLAVAIPGVVTLQTAIDYAIDRDMTKTEQANFIKGYSAALASRRVVNVWSDTLETPVGQVVSDLPGFYGAAAIGAITTGLPTQQGFTNLSISGFLGLKHSTGYFTDDQLDIIADGGTMILAQSGPEQPLFIRHQLTTDRSAIKFQEYSVTKNVDFIAKFMRNAFAGFIGRYNIVDTTLDELRGTAKAVLTFLKDDTRLPRIGGVIRSGVLTQLVESPTQIDTVKMRFKLDIPIPLNNLDITIEV